MIPSKTKKMGDEEVTIRQTKNNNNLKLLKFCLMLSLHFTFQLSNLLCHIFLLFLVSLCGRLLQCLNLGCLKKI